MCIGTTSTIIRIYQKNDEVLAVHFEDPTEYSYIIIKDEEGLSIDGTWTVYSPLADIHEEVVDYDELLRYIGQTILLNKPVIIYREAEEMGETHFRSCLRELQDQAKTWDVNNKERHV